MIRSFVALDLPDPAASALETWQAGLPAGRAVPPENLHLTLAFLGDRETAALEDLHLALTRLRPQRFEVRLSGIDLFGGAGRAVVAAGVRTTAELTALHHALGGAAHASGMVLERRRFRPHVTIARLPRGPGDGARGRLQAWISATATRPAIIFEAQSFSLYRSDLHPDGARHTELARYPLG